MTWDTLTKPERHAAVTYRRSIGMTSDNIAAELGTTRNAIIGFAYREKIPTVNVAPKIKEARKERIRKPVMVPNTPPDPPKPPRHVAKDSAWEPIEGVEPVTIMELPWSRYGACRWPVVGGYCGIECEGKTYCPTHHGMGNTPVDRMRVPKEARL